MNSAKHPPETALLDYALGRLSDPDLDRIGSHVEECPPCQETLVGLENHQDTYLEALKTAPSVGSLPGLEPSSELIRRIALVASEASDVPDEPTSQRLGPYALHAKIGGGGMGDVYRAEHTKLGRQVALKLLPRKSAESPERVERFEREMRAVGGLHHPHIVQAYDAGEHDGQLYLSMELLDGTDLADLVGHEGVLPVAEACELVRQAALGLAHAHAAGLVHRDIKPSNLMLTRDGTVKLLDLGLAASSLASANLPPDAAWTEAAWTNAEEAADTDPRLTRAGQLLGTPDFMSPEHCVAARRVDHRSDLYSLGSTLYFLLTSRAPFSGRVFDTVAKKVDVIANREAPPITDRRPDLDASLAWLVGRMLALNPAERFESADAVANALEPFAAGAQLPRLLGGSSAGQPPPPSATPGAVGVQTGSAGGVPPYAKWLAAAAAGAAGLIAWMVLTIRTPDGTLVVEAPDNAAASLRVTVSKDDEQATTTAADGWALALKQGDWRVELRDPTGEYDLDRAEVTIESGQKQVVRLARRDPKKPQPPKPPTPPVVIPPQPPAPPVTLPQRVAFEVAHPMSADWDLQCDLYTLKYTLDEEGRVVIDGLTPTVRDQYVGKSGDRTLIDERIFLRLSDPSRGFWPVLIHMTTTGAESLHRTLSQAVEAHTNQYGDDAEPDDRGVIAVFATADHEMQSHGRVALSRKIQLKATADYRVDGEVVRRAPTLVVEDLENKTKPLTISLPAPAIENLQRELAQAIRRKKAAMRQSVTLQTVAGYYVGARSGGGGSVNALSDRPKTSEILTLEWLDAQRLRCQIKTRSGHYLHAELGGGGGLNAEPKEPGSSEVFEFEWLDRDRTKARLRTPRGTYVRAAEGGGAEVDARAIKPDPTTVFTVRPARLR